MAGVTTSYQVGVHGSRPANGAGCILYSCTTHNLVYRDDGTTWTTFLTIATAGGITGTAAPGVTLSTTNSAGVATTVIATDATIAVFDATVPTTSALADAAAAGSAGKAARRDHVHGRESFATPAIVLGTAAAAGSAATPIRSDATIVAFDATVPTTQALGDSAATGSAAVAAKRDHKHAMPTAAITTSGLTQATGKLLGRSTAGTGAIEAITVGTNLTLSGGTLDATGGGGSLTVKDEGSALATDATSLDFVGAGVVASGTGAAKTITIAGGSSGGYIDSIALDGTYGTEFDEASLPAGRTRPSGLVVGDETYQSAGGSFLRVTVASTGGAADKAYYISSAPAGNCEMVLSMSYTSTSESDMIGPGIADSSGNGVAAIIYQGSLRTIAIASGHYSSLQGTLSTNSYLGWGSPMWIKLRRSTNDWYASISLDGYNFGLETGAYNVACTAARTYFGCYWSTEAGVMCLGRLNKIA